ncbi:histidine kinase [Streptomonospora sediminis]
MAPAAADALLDALWRRAEHVARWLPADDPDDPGAAGTAAPPLLGGVCAAIAARTGRPAAEVRRSFARQVVPALAYPLLWLVRLAGRPGAEGRERFDGILFLGAAALFTAVASAAQLWNSGAEGLPATAAGAALGAPLLALRGSVLLVWRLMTAAVAVSMLMLPAGDAVPVPVAAAVFYLAVLFVAGTQYDRSVVAAIGACTAAVVILGAVPQATAGVWCAIAAAAVLLIGDNVRLRGAHAGRLHRMAAAAPATPRKQAAAAHGDAGGGAVRPRGPRNRDPAHNGVPGPAAIVRAVWDALWGTPGNRPQGPLRLFHGPHRPAQGRIVAGVCAGLARGSQPMAITLRILFPIVSLPLGIAVYLLLWLVLPDERTGPAGGAGPESAGAAGEGPQQQQPAQPREVTAWFVLFGLSCGVAALVAVQLVEFYQLDVVVSVLLGGAVGLPFALLPFAPLLCWRIMAAGLVAVLIAVGNSAPPLPAGVAALPQYHLWPWPVAALVALPVVLYAVAVNYPGRTTVGVGMVTVTACFLSAYPLVGTHPGQTAWLSAAVAAVLLFGYNVRSRRAAQQRLARESALRRRDRARQALLEERSRIARELHDVVSHHMSMIAIQADAAPYKFRELGSGPAGTFTAIRDAAREALAETRRVVGLLREEHEAPENAPQPGLAMLPDLVEGVRQAAVDVTLEGGPQAAHEAAQGLPGAVDLSAYRIVQESVSNAGRHAVGSPVTITLTRTPSLLTVRVSNGPPPGGDPGTGSEPGGNGAAGADSGGHGLVGMRERAAMLGGRLLAGPTENGGFDVVAELPVGSSGGDEP